MATMIEKAKNILSPKQAAHETAVKAALADAIEKEKRLADLSSQFTETGVALDAAERKAASLAIDALADAAADKQYQTAIAEVERLTALLKKLEYAKLDATARVTEAKLAIRQIKKRDYVWSNKAWCTKRKNAGVKITDAVQALYAALVEIAEVGDKQRRSWPGIPPQHALLFEREIIEGVSHEMARISGREFIGGSHSDTRPPELPGSKWPWETNHDKSKIPSLAEVIETANAYLMKLLDDLPLPSSEPAEPENTPTLRQGATDLNAPVAAAEAKVLPAKGQTEDFSNYVPPKSSVRI